MAEPNNLGEGVAATTGAAGALGLVMGIARGVIEQRHGSVRGWIAGIASAVVVSLVLGWALSSMDWPDGAKWAVIGASAYIADDVLAGWVAIGRAFRGDPLGFFGRILASVRGRREGDR